MDRDPPFAEVLGQAQDAVLITDADLSAPGPRIVFANAAFGRLTGYDPAELVGESPRRLQGRETDPAVLAELRRRLAAGEPFVGQTVNYRKDGTPFRIEWRVSPVHGEGGRVTHYLSMHRDVTRRAEFDREIEHYVGELLEQNARLLALVTTDGLTGLANHRQFQEAVAAAVKSHPVVSVAMVDVDAFKAYNDAFGHPAGDAVLRQLAGVMRGAVRGGIDTVARYGGEEFAVILPGLDDDHAIAAADRVRSAVAGTVFPRRAVTVSVGLATATDGGETTATALIDAADAALYAAKAQGRDRVRHQRHLGRDGAATPVVELKPAAATAGGCASSANGCLRCEAAPGGGGACGGSNAPALLLGPQDADAAATLDAALATLNLTVDRLGPVRVARDVGKRLGEVAAVLKGQLTPYTKSCVRAAYAAGGAATAEQAMAALLFAEPLGKMLDRVEHEWVRTALADGWLFSVYHPIIRAATGAPFAMEALLRARDPADGRTIGAGPIIGACEALNLTHQLDQRARQSAIRGAAVHVPATQKVFINFLPNTIYDPEICLRTTMAAADEVGLPLGRLVFEVVETEDIPDMARLRHILDYYRARGVGTAVDDMGAGFTSVEYVKALRPDYVKLDRDLVVAAERDPAERPKVFDLVRTCHDLGATVIAEGIETASQMHFCIDAGVDLLQGFLFAKPAVPPQAVTYPAATVVRKAA